MSQSFKEYRKFARRATRDLLVCKTRAEVQKYIDRINASKTEAEVSRVMADVREAI